MCKKRIYGCEGIESYDSLGNKIKEGVIDINDADGKYELKDGTQIKRRDTLLQ